MNKNISLIGESHVLGCGDTIECKETVFHNRFAIPSFPHLCKAPFKVYEFVVQERVIFAAADKRLFDLLHEPMLKMFQKLFSTVSPMKCNMLVRGTTLLVSESERLLHEIQKMDYTAEEAVFLHFLMIYGATLGATMDESERKEIVLSTMEYFESETFDTVDKINRIIQPWYTILGMENVKLLSSIDLRFKHAKILKNDPELLLMFTNFCAFHAEDLSNVNKSIKDLKFREVDFNYSRNFSNTPELFFKLPIYSQSFRKRFMELHVSEAMLVCKNFPERVSGKHFIEWMDHNILMAQKYNEDSESKDKENVVKTVTNAVFSHFNLDPKSWERKDIEILISMGSEMLGYSVVASDYFPNNMDKFTSVEQLNETHKQMVQNFGGKWIKEHQCIDYILLKLHEALGSELTVKIIDEVSQNGASLTAAQWLMYPDYHDELKDVPMEWWGSLLGESDEVFDFSEIK